MVSIIVPCYNEKQNIITVLSSLKKLPDPKEIIIVDDGSMDGTADIVLAEVSSSSPQKSGYRIQAHILSKNYGKGFALRTGLAISSGKFVVFWDADSEYDPDDIKKIVYPLAKGWTHVCYGSRFLNADVSGMTFSARAANRFLTALVRICTGMRMTDMETGAKAFHRSALDEISLQENRFAIEPEVTIKLAKKGYAVYEVPIGYRARTRAQGKKIGWRDGVEATWKIIKYSLVS